MAKSPMRKLHVFIIIMSLALVIGAGLRLYNHLNPTIVANHALIIKNESLEELEESADLIVIATVDGKGRQEELEPDSYIFNTFTPVRVDKVLKGDVNQGDIIEIAEHYGYVIRPQQTFIYTMENYLPMEQKSTYLLFLIKSQNGWLRVSSVYQGKFVWPIPKTLSTNTLKINEITEDYQSLLEEVRTKYSNTD